MTVSSAGVPALAVLALNLGGITAPVASQEPDRGRLEQLQRVQPELLARAYLVNQYTLGLIDMARQGATVHVQDGNTAVTVTAANLDSVTAEYQRRRATYVAAIEARGFTRVTGEFELSTAGCGPSFGPMLLEIRQDGFVVTLGDGISAIVVDRTMVLGRGSESEGTYSHGEVRDGGVELRRFDNADCTVRLTRYLRPNVRLANPEAILGRWEGK